MDELEKRVFDFFISLCPDYLSPDFKIGVACSGGADSICLLTLISKFIPKEKIFCITVNHNIRPQEETFGDALFVKEYCDSLGIFCSVYDIERGKIIALAQIENLGTEAAARNQRYEAFSEFISAHNLNYLALAHNSNDQQETLVMRFLNGSTALYGIKSSRGKFIRPLLKTDRASIESYLVKNGISWRTDATNSDNNYQRNNIRNNLLPYLKQQVPFLESSLETLEKKASIEQDFILKSAQDFYNSAWVKKNPEAVSIEADAFDSLHLVLRINVLYLVLDHLKVMGRIPFDFVEKASSVEKKIELGNLVILREKGRIFVQKNLRVATESGFFVTIYRVGCYKCGSFSINVKALQNGFSLTFESFGNCSGAKKIYNLQKLDFPFCIRSLSPADTVSDKSGKNIRVKKVLENWKLADKNAVPLVQKLDSPDQEIICICGGLFGAPDWIKV